MINIDNNSTMVIIQHQYISDMVDCFPENHLYIYL